MSLQVERADDLASHHQGDAPAEAVEAASEGNRAARELVIACLEWRSRHGRADTSHQDAEDWWSCLDAGPPCDWDDVESFSGPCEGRTPKWWREAATDARAIDASLDEAVEAWGRHDVEACLSALDDARRTESDYGDWPATQALAEQLLGDSALLDKLT